MDLIIFNIFISSIAFTLSVIAFGWLSTKESLFSVRYLFLIFAVAKFTEIGNFFFIDSRIQEILGLSYFEISQIVGNIMMIAYPIANANIVLSILSTSPEKLKNRNKIILLLSIFCVLIPILTGGNGMKMIFLGLGIIIIPILIQKLNKEKKMLRKRNIYNTIVSFELVQLLAVLLLTIFHFVNNEPLDPTINVTTGAFIRGEDIGIINFLIILNGFLWLKNSQLNNGKFFIENSFLNTTIDNSWILKDDKKKKEFILKYYQNSLQFENTINKILILEDKFVKNEAMFDNLEEMSNLLDVKTIELRNIYDEFNKQKFSKNLIILKMRKAKYLIDNSYLNNNSINDLMGIVKYKSKSAFINNFKTVTGTTPVAYSKINKDVL
ncbi:MAG: hypothetical protein P8H54_01675 [Flavobacteriaceae bacterium]|nr:hypothetical protein [Flavobacteriaceae bacterium]